jgi:hypothetical protein
MNTLITTINTTNPDSGSIQTKNTIDISFSMTELSASKIIMSSSADYALQLKPNYTTNGLVLEVPRTEGAILSSEGYYTPMYTEKINYDQWKLKINKVFLELT